MSTRLLSRAPLRARPELALAEGLALARGRVHEAAGPARRSFALMLAGRAEGTVLWIAPAWMPERLHPDGARAFLDPGRLVFVTPRRAEDLLWTMEEALRAGLVGLVVADLPGAPGLTPVRRLQLAAETGAEIAGPPPLGLLLTPGDGGAAGVESRWHMAPRHLAAATAWRLERRRARSDPPRGWTLGLERGALRIGD